MVNRINKFINEWRILGQDLVWSRVKMLRLVPWGIFQRWLHRVRRMFLILRGFQQQRLVRENHRRRNQPLRYLVLMHYCARFLSSSFYLHFPSLYLINLINTMSLYVPKQSSIDIHMRIESDTGLIMTIIDRRGIQYRIWFNIYNSRSEK